MDTPEPEIPMETPEVEVPAAPVENLYDTAVEVLKNIMSEVILKKEGHAEDAAEQEAKAIDEIVEQLTKAVDAIPALPEFVKGFVKNGETIKQIAKAIEDLAEHAVGVALKVQGK